MIDHNVDNAIRAYVEVAVHVYSTAYGVAMAVRLPEERAGDFAKEILRSFMIPKQEKTEAGLLKMVERMSPGGSA